MAVTKRIKVGGAYYEGYKIAVSSAAASYPVYVENAGGAALNGMSIIPDSYGVGDTIVVTHYAGSSGAGNVVAILATNMYNMGQNSAIVLDLPAAEQVDSGHSIKVTYVNAASIAMNVYVLAEWIGIKVTA